jgi:hypothetical protein
MKITDVLFEELIDEEVYLWEMANLSKRMTGLPMSIFISTKDSVMDRHGPRIKVMTTHSDRVNPAQLTPIGIGGPVPVDFRGELSPADFSHVAEFVQTNKDILLAFWNKEIDIEQFLSQMVTGR